MMRRLPHLLAFLVALLAAGCDGTPLPTPPSADPHRMALVEDQGDRVVLSGEAGAVRPGGVDLRVTGAQGAVVRPVEEDGAFIAALRGRRTDVFYLEVLQGGAETFVLAVTGGPGTSVEPAEPSADEDTDGSPDPIDCDPNDPGAGGRECEPADDGACNALAELCNQADDDCDGAVDEDVCECVSDAGCAGNQTCEQGQCSNTEDPAGNAPCQVDGDCLAGQQCLNGTCESAGDPNNVECQADGDCGAGQSCQNGTCFPDNGAG